MTPDAAALLYEVYCDVDDIPILDGAHEVFAHPIDYAEILDQDPAFRRWWPFVLTNTVDLDALADVSEFDPVVPPPSAAGIAQITALPDGVDAEQTTLDA